MNKKIVIFGAGIAGLTIAHTLVQYGFDIHIYEKDQRLGGMARSFRYEDEVPTEHSWRGYAPFYYNLFDVLSQIPISNQIETFNSDPMYTIEEVQKHRTKDDGWVYYQNNVYNITEFIQKHPGGDIILNCLGGDLETYWQRFGVEWHSYNPVVWAYLKKYRIGRLADNQLNLSKSELKHQIVSDNLTIKTLDFNLYSDDLSNINRPIQISTKDYPYLLYVLSKVMYGSDSRSSSYFQEKLLPYLKNKISEDSYHYIVDYLSGPGFGFDKETVSAGTFATFVMWILNSGNKGWKVMNQPTNEAWFDHWGRYLIQKGVKFHFNSSLSEIRHSNHGIQSCQINNLNWIQGDEFIIAINPNNLWEIFQKSQLFELANQHRSLYTVNNQISFRIGFKRKINMPTLNSGYVLVDSPYNITFYAQEDSWDKNVKLGLDGKIKSLWSGTLIATYMTGSLYHLPATKLTKDQLIKEIIYQIFNSQQLKYHLMQNNSKIATLEDIIYVEIFDDWYWDGSQLKSKNLKWVNNYLNESYRPTNLTQLSNLYLAGAHTQTSVNIWSMEGAAESGKLTSNLILNKYQLPQTYIFTHQKTLPQKLLSKTDQLLYSIGLPNIIDVIIFICVCLFLMVICQLYLFFNLNNQLYLILPFVLIIIIYIKVMLSYNV